MSGLTTEQHQKLIESIRQWGESQTRIQAEQDHQAALAAILKGECGISEKHFKRVAKAYWDDKVEKDRADAELQLDIFEQVRGFGAAINAARFLRENGATLERVSGNA